MSKNFEEKEASQKSGRRLAREELFKIIFETEILNENINEVYSEYLKRDEVLKGENNLEFLKKYSEGISQEINLIKGEIIKNLENWEFKRLGTVERSLLIISTYEILKTDLATQIIVNEAVELAKEYGDSKTFEFVNGVLAKIIKANK